MSTSSVFVNSRAQAVRLPADTRFPDDVKQVNVRIVGKDRVLSPVDNTWDSFFLSEEHVGKMSLTRKILACQKSGGSHSKRVNASTT